MIDAGCVYTCGRIRDRVELDLIPLAVVLLLEHALAVVTGRVRGLVLRSLRNRLLRSEHAALRYDAGARTADRDIAFLHDATLLKNRGTVCVGLLNSCEEILGAQLVVCRHGFKLIEALREGNVSTDAHTCEGIGFFLGRELDGDVIRGSEVIVDEHDVLLGLGTVKLYGVATERLAIDGHVDIIVTGQIIIVETEEALKLVALGIGHIICEDLVGGVVQLCEVGSRDVRKALQLCDLLVERLDGLALTLLITSGSGCLDRGQDNIGSDVIALVVLVDLILCNGRLHILTGILEALRDVDGLAEVVGGDVLDGVCIGRRRTVWVRHAGRLDEGDDLDARELLIQGADQSLIEGREGVLIVVASEAEHSGVILDVGRELIRDDEAGVGTVVTSECVVVYEYV